LHPLSHDINSAKFKKSEEIKNGAWRHGAPDALASTLGGFLGRHGVDAAAGFD
jgi:hypothetical protein